MGAIDLLVNGRHVSVEDPPLHRTLLDHLRDLGLTGAKEGCAEGECGACVVAMVAADGAGSEYRGVNSCLVPLVTAAGHEIYTVEALATDGGLIEPQRAMAAAGASQCGYCTPGFVMSLFTEYYRPRRDAPCSGRELGGNLCRCTGYRPIRDALASLGPAPADRFAARLTRPAPRLGPIVADSFVRPVTVEECITELAKAPAAAIIAGGTDLAVEANLKGRRWPRLVSVDAVAELREISVSETGVSIGAAASLTDVGRHWGRGRPDAVEELLWLFSSPTIRNRATLGGNLATASPIGDSAPLLLALDAAVVIAGRDGRRTVPLADFFTGYRKTVLERAELIVSITIPAPFPELLRFYKVSKRASDDISTVAAAIAITRDSDGRVERARFAFGGVAATPVRVAGAEAAVGGAIWDEIAVARARGAIERELQPMSDHRGSKEYRRHVASSLVEKFWWDSTRPERGASTGSAL